MSTFPIFQAGERFNVISESAYMEGSIRSFENGLKDVITDKIKTFIEETRSRGFTVEYDQHTNAPINSNT